MKRTPIKRRTPLRAKTPLKAKTGLKTKSALVRHTPLKNNTPLKPTELKRSGLAPGVANAPLRAGVARPAAPKRKSGMAGKGRSQQDKAFHQTIVRLGCIACSLARVKTLHPLQVHHPEGRNKGRAGDYSEQYAMCLCAEHHDQRIYKGYFNGNEFIPVRDNQPSVHHAKKAFTTQIGSEALLVHLTYERLRRQPPWLTAEEWVEFCLEQDSDAREAWLIESMHPKHVSDRRKLHATQGAAG